MSNEEQLKKDFDTLIREFEDVRMRYQEKGGVIDVYVRALCFEQAYVALAQTDPTKALISAHEATSLILGFLQEREKKESPAADKVSA